MPQGRKPSDTSTSISCQKCPRTFVLHSYSTIYTQYSVGSWPTLVTMWLIMSIPMASYLVSQGQLVALASSAHIRYIATQSSHYAQAHALLNLQLIHASPSLSAPEGDETEGQAAGFGIYSPLKPVEPSADGEKSSGSPHDFTSQDLLSVCKRLLQEKYVSYFPLCREMGASVVDGLVRGESRVSKMR